MHGNASFEVLMHGNAIFESLVALLLLLPSPPPRLLLLLLLGRLVQQVFGHGGQTACSMAVGNAGSGLSCCEAVPAHVFFWPRRTATSVYRQDLRFFCYSALEAMASRSFVQQTLQRNALDWIGDCEHA